MNGWPNAKQIVQVEVIRRGVGHVRKVLLECGHSKETMGRPVLGQKMVCEVCRKA